MAGGEIGQLCDLHIPMSDISVKHTVVPGHTHKIHLQVVMETPTLPPS